MKRTKIVGTIGPASETKTKIERLVKSGLNVARLNFSHGSYDHHRMLIANIRTIEKKLATPVAILQDLQGPRIRIGAVAKEGVALKRGESVALVPEGSKIAPKGVGTVLPTQYADLYKDVKAGHTILIDDGRIQLEVISAKNKIVMCKVAIPETVFSHKGMNFPDSDIRCPSVTEKDREDLQFGIEQEVDFVALSFVRDADDVTRLRRSIVALEARLGRRGKEYDKPKRLIAYPTTRTKIIAKIERPQAVKNFEQILAVSDGIMVARGDLGLEMPLEDLPMAQKTIIRQCTEQGKPVIVATQMLDSMIRNPIPTRAEVSDVANAILDGTDAIMLSGETASGKYPLQAVQMMTRIAHEIEREEIAGQQRIEADLRLKPATTEAIAFSAQDIAEQLGAKYVVCATTSGYTARQIAKYKSRIPLLAMAATKKTQRQLCLSWGVRPQYLPYGQTFHEFSKHVRDLLISQKLVKKGDLVVIAAGQPLAYLGPTNGIRVEQF